MEIIGVTHSRNEISQVVAMYIDQNHPNLESIMLELPPEYKRLDGNEYPFFRPMADYYESKGVRVIPGDRKRWAVMGLSYDEAVDMYHNNFLKFITLDYISTYVGFLNGRLFRDRNQDMDALCKQEKPEVVVVGAIHAKYLKAQNPGSQFHYFTERERIIRKIVNRSTFRSADSIWYIDADSCNPAIKKEYLRNSLTCLAAGGLVTATMLLDLPELISLPAVGVGTYAFLNKFGSVIDYVKTLRREQKERK
ncbi:MAG: hypothetical protein V1729_04925 [Candidatus Woesearchaeota archaeon]